MSFFDHLFEIIIDHPVITGSFGAFVAAIIAALLGIVWLAILLVIVGVVIIFVSNR